jgi:heat shock protein HslJ
MNRNHDSTTFGAVALLALLGSGCATTVLISPSGTIVLFSGTWVATEVDGFAANVSPRADLAFETDRRVSGSSGCNRYVAELNPSPPSVRMGSVAGTQQICAPPVMEQERRFINALELTTTQVVDGDTMHFINGTGRTVIRFTRVNATGDR